MKKPKYVESARPEDWARALEPLSRSLGDIASAVRFQAQVNCEHVWVEAETVPASDAVRSASTASFLYAVPGFTPLRCQNCKMERYQPT